jgi:hypothetical protein
MIKLINILQENKILIPRRSPEERQKNFNIIIQKKLQQYIKNGGKGDLNLDNTLITSLPQNLKVGTDLWLRNTPLSSLPQGLKVGGHLFLQNTSITSLPQDIEVEGNVFLNRTPIIQKYTNEQIKQMSPGIKGNIYI